MARPRRRHDIEAQRAASIPDRSPSASSGTAPDPGVDVDRDAAIARERAADLLVQLAGAWQREHMDYGEPAHERFLDWMAAEARAALTPAERAQLSREAEAFAKRMTAALEARDRAREGDGGG